MNHKHSFLALVSLVPGNWKCMAKQLAMHWISGVFGLIACLLCLGPLGTCSTNVTLPNLDCVSFNSSECEFRKKALNVSEDAGVPECKPSMTTCYAKENKSLSCYAIWRFNNTERLKGLMVAGCSNHSTIAHPQHCIGNEILGEKDSRDKTTCDCTRHMCNENFTFNSVASKSTSAERSARSNGNASFAIQQSPPHLEITDTTIIVACIIGTVAVLSLTLVVLYVWRWQFRKGRRTPSTSPSLSICDESSVGSDSEFKSQETLKIDKSILKGLSEGEGKKAGAFGTIYPIGIQNGRDCVVKIIAAKDKSFWERELNIYRSPGMKHENILLFVSVASIGDEKDAPLGLVLEYHPHGSLYDYLKGHNLTWETTLRMSSSLMTGLAYLHDELVHEGKVIKYPIAHQDLKSKNVLVKQDLTIVISDFNLAQPLQKEKLDACLGNLKGVKGTTRYLAPEVLEMAISFSREAFLRIDVYAAALLLWEIVSRCDIVCGNGNVDYKLPFEDKVGLNPTFEQMKDIVVNQRARPTFPSQVFALQGADQLIQAIEEAWDQEAEARLSAECVASRIANLGVSGNKATSGNKVYQPNASVCDANNVINEVYHSMFPRSDYKSLKVEILANI